MQSWLLLPRRCSEPRMHKGLNRDAGRVPKVVFPHPSPQSGGVLLDLHREEL